MKYLCSRGFEILRFAQDDKYAVLYCLVILNAVKNLGSCGFEIPRRSRSVGMTDTRLSLCFPETHTRRITYQPKWRFQFLPFSFQLSVFSFQFPINRPKLTTLAERDPHGMNFIHSSCDLSLLVLLIVRFITINRPIARDVQERHRTRYRRYPVHYL